jgi:hypothetical protein
MQGWSKFDEGSVDPETGVARKICPVKLGFGLGLDSVRIYDDLSMHCMQDVLASIIPKTLAGTKEKQMQWRDQHKSIQKMLAEDKLHFFVARVNPETVIEVDERPSIPKQVRLHNWFLASDDDRALKSGGNGGSREDSVQPIDILQEHLIRHTNSNNIQSACVVLNMAIRAGALRLPVYDDRYFCFFEAWFFLSEYCFSHPQDCSP